MDYQIIDNALQITVDARLYNESVVYKCFYWYGKDFNVEIEVKDDPGPFYKVTFELFNGKSYNDWKELVSKIKRDLIDFKLRDIIATETKAIRELIVAKAFAHYEVETFSQSDVSDPVGFDPQNMQ